MITNECALYHFCFFYTFEAACVLCVSEFLVVVIKTEERRSRSQSMDKKPVDATPSHINKFRWRRECSFNYIRTAQKSLCASCQPRYAFRRLVILTLSNCYFLAISFPIFLRVSSARWPRAKLIDERLNLLLSPRPIFCSGNACRSLCACVEKATHPSEQTHRKAAGSKSFLLPRCG